MSNPILILIEHQNGKIRKGSLEALAAAGRLARESGCQTAALIIDGGPLVTQLANSGATTLFNVKTAASAESRDTAVEIGEKFIRQSGARYVFAAATAYGKDVLARLAARFQVSLVQDVIEIRLENDRLLLKRPIYAGKAYETVALLANPGFVTIRPNVLPMPEGNSPAAGITAADEAVAPERIRTRTVERKFSGAGKVELTEATVIVSGGRGIKGPEHYQLIEELASVLGAAAGASRAIVDAGWVDHHHQVGQTGKTVSPNLYIAAGISGAIQHMAGMSSSKYIVAINKDPEAPIFKVANYGIVGDLFQILPLLTTEFKKLLSQ